MSIRLIRIILPAAILFLLPGLASSKDLLYPRGWKVTPSENRTSQTHRGFKSDVSDRNILGLQRPSLYSLPTAKHGLPLAMAVMEDTIRVLVLKVEFQPEIPDDPNTTGNGTFDMRSYDEFVAQEGHYIDPAPHTSAYFASHMEALRRFWYFVSDKKLDLSWDIYPQSESLAFRLPVHMNYYGSGGPWADSSIGDRLGHFVIDAITFADSAAPEIDFSHYQAVIIFHAGSDQQDNIAFINDTPDDFFTGFLRLGAPIPVDNGAYAVSEALQVPETVSQDNRINALNGVIAHEFGHQLGLVDLYNTSNFMTQIGDFSLMDDNGMSVGVEFDSLYSTVGGTIPVYPDAWSRAYLGFDIPRVITRGSDETVSAAVLNYPDSEIVKVPITDFEYYLIENRQQVNPQTALIADHQTGVILGPGYVENSLLIANGEYDLLAPGNGMLIWHVDEYVAYQDTTRSGYNNFLVNTLQWNKDRRFLSLVEADGVVDFGGNYYRGYGDQNDFFYGNGGATSFTPFTRPSSRTNLGANSHISITGISRSDTFMTADIDNDWLIPGWPQMSQPGTMSDPIIADIGAFGTNSVVMAAGNKILAWRFDGAKIIPNYDSIGLVRYDIRDTLTYPLAVIADCDSAIVGRPLPVDINGDGATELVVLTQSGALYAVKASDIDENGRADDIAGFPYQIGNGANLAPIAVDFLAHTAKEILAISNSEAHLIYSNSPDPNPIDTLLFSIESSFLSMTAYTVSGKNVIDFIQTGTPESIIRMTADSGTVNFTQQFSLVNQDAKYIVSGEINRDGGMPEIVAVCDNAVKLISADGIIKWSVDIPDLLGRPALGDLNSDGYPEIVVSGDSKIYALSYNGAMLNNFPLDLRLYDLRGEIESPSILGDIDADGNPDIIVGLPAGSVYAFNYHGDKLAGFPLPSSFGISRACALGDLNGDFRVDLITVENSGFVKPWGIDTTYAPGNIPWSVSGGDLSNSNYLGTVFEKPVVSADLQLPENSVFNYPNPAKNSTTIRYYLNSDSQVSIDIFDMMGERVHNVKLSGAAHVSNEYVWDCSRIASGVYFCRVEAQSSADKAWRMIKIAIAK